VRLKTSLLMASSASLAATLWCDWASCSSRPSLFLRPMFPPPILDYSLLPLESGDVLFQGADVVVQGPGEVAVVAYGSAVRRFDVTVVRDAVERLVAFPQALLDAFCRLPPDPVVDVLWAPGRLGSVGSRRSRRRSRSFRPTLHLLPSLVVCMWRRMPSPRSKILIVWTSIPMRRSISSDSIPFSRPMA
jgi:hypothetical protein